MKISKKLAIAFSFTCMSILAEALQIHFSNLTNDTLHNAVSFYNVTPLKIVDTIQPQQLVGNAGLFDLDKSGQATISFTITTGNNMSPAHTALITLVESKSASGQFISSVGVWPFSIYSADEKSVYGVAATALANGDLNVEVGPIVPTAK